MNRFKFLSSEKLERRTPRSSQMKYVYKIFRMFFCPHRWNRISVENMVKTGTNDITAEVRTFRCRYCGKEEVQTVRFDGRK